MKNICLSLLFFTFFSSITIAMQTHTNQEQNNSSDHTSINPKSKKFYLKTKDGTVLTYLPEHYNSKTKPNNNKALDSATQN